MNYTERSENVKKWKTLFLGNHSRLRKMSMIRVVSSQTKCNLRHKILSEIGNSNIQIWCTEIWYKCCFHGFVFTGAAYSISLRAFLSQYPWKWTNSLAFWYLLIIEVLLFVRIMNRNLLYKWGYESLIVFRMRHIQSTLYLSAHMLVTVCANLTESTCKCQNFNSGTIN